MLTVNRRILISAPRESVESFLSAVPDQGLPRTTGRVMGVTLPRLERRTVLRPVNGGTVLEHGDGYRIPFFLAPLKPLLQNALDAELETELHALKEGAEALNRRIQLERIEGV
jgi:vacuolar-type H+-ATPase subunit D/Vma8